MKTMIVISEKRLDDHAGEYYDDIFEVPHQPIDGEILEYAKSMKEMIKKTWESDVKDEERKGEPVVSISLDAASPFNAMLIDYQLVLKETDGIIIDLPYLSSITNSTNDPEALECLAKLDSIKKGAE